MNWQEVCQDPVLQNLPYKIELNQWGQVVMSPVKVYHSRFQGEITFLLRKLLGPGVATEFAIKRDESSNQTFVADVAWMSQERARQIDPNDASPIAPEICIEIISASNTEQELLEKRLFYFEKGTQEFWRCDREGDMRFFTPEGEIEQSVWVPDFPKKIVIHE